jgi:hypothetical protein
MSNPASYLREVLVTLDETLQRRGAALADMSAKAESGEISYETYDSAGYDWNEQVVEWAEAVVRAAKTDGLIPR